MAKHKIGPLVGALVKWLWDMTHVQKAVGSNHDTVYSLDMTFFTFIYCKNVMMFV